MFSMIMILTLHVYTAENASFFTDFHSALDNRVKPNLTQMPVYIREKITKE
jgi:hypothetical protein